MRKVEEYVREYRAVDGEKGQLDVLEKIAIAIAITEVKELMASRNVRRNEAYFTILNEQEKRWRAFTKRIGPDKVPENLFFEIHRKIASPSVHRLWTQSHRPKRLVPR